MFKYQSSLQNKVRYGYYLCLVMIIVISALNFFNLKRIERKIAFSFITTELFDAALEMRRFEKNYFLYNDKDSYSENLRFTEIAENIIQKNKNAIKKLAIETNVIVLESDIKEYKSLMQQFVKSSSAHSHADLHKLELKIRETGKNIVNTAQFISTKEREYIQSLITASNRVILASVVLIVVAGWLIGKYLSHMVVNPLQELQDNMQRIADGKFETSSELYPGSKDKEILSLNKACSRMIQELEFKQMKVIAQSDKLATLGTMVSGIAHQLNNPLSNISSSCQILQEEVASIDKDYEKELLQQIEGEIERAKAMVHSLLEFSRKKEFKIKPEFLKDLLKETIQLLRGEIPSNIEITTDISEDIVITVNKQRIQQALLNIIKNGIDSIADKGEISVCARRNLKNKTVEIKIKDTGTGIEPENIERIFEPFFTTKGDEKGSGLGLFVANEIIKEHEGHIGLDSTVGQGTTFMIVLPLKEA
ncbi:MAG TPA: hypothetical protein DD713_00355 [Nitrospiraceae bacterium]|nr:hypothetical protein [Nitrospiraceae bacterium]